jgi:hypothetical protein
MEFIFEAVEHLSLENSFGTLKHEEVTLRVEVGVREDNSYGWFEMYDIATGGGEWYAEGGLWFDENKMLVDYDGVFSLPECILDCLRNNGFDTSYMG